ncbi:MAG: UvrD-helicase domain-containing protein [Campylobacterota bacterium]|nr:UvrD-helicase domain-containing protein [Campylobacterota bacterium]
MCKFNKFTIQQNFAISAGAGSGKTYTLSRRYINAVLGFDFFTDNKSDTPEDELQANFIEYKDEKKADLSQIITMTYTKAAALEMSERIFDLMDKIIGFETLDTNNGDYDSIAMGMDRLSSNDKEYVVYTLDNALNNSNNAFISTIHAFCLDTIAVNSDIAKVDSTLSTIEDVEKLNILNEVRLETLEENKELAYKVFTTIDKFKANQLIEKYTTNSKFRDSFDHFIKNPIAKDLYINIIKDLSPIPTQDTDKIESEIDNAKDSDIRRKWFDEYVENFENLDAKIWTTFTIETVFKSGVNKGKTKVSSLSLGEKKFPYLNEFVKTMDKLVPIYSKPDDELEKEFNSKVQIIHKLLVKIYDKYQERLVKENKIDFDTIISKTEQIIDKVDTDYKYIMIDEYQDTNSLQNKIIHKISKDRNLFVVGDSKQSIYSFQGAELEVFNNSLNEQDYVEHMSINYRSDKKILAYVNKVFENLFDKENKNSFVSTNFKAKFTESDKLNCSSEDKSDGTVEYLISENIKDSDSQEQYQNLAKFIKSIKEDEIDGYDEIKKLIKEEKKAIGILFDSKAKMMLLKKELNLLGVECKVSASESFYHTTEVNDIFLVLKSISILKSKSYKKDDDKFKKLFSKDRYFIAGALRSNILRYNEEQIVDILKQNLETITDIFRLYIEQSEILSISSLIKYIIDDSKLLDIYAYLGDIDQRDANIEKLIDMSIQYETNNSSDLYNYLEELKTSIYFVDDTKENEAFYKSPSVESIELCTIHSTKGLAYPMVILGQSEKNVLNKTAQEFGLSFNSFTLNTDNGYVEYGAVGFKVADYEPLIYRILKKISKNKGEAERKRLLYVALTRAEHNIVISGSVSKTKADKITLADDSYLTWLTKNAFDIDKQSLLSEKIEGIKLIDKSILSDEPIKQKDTSFVKYEKQTVKFKEFSNKTASNSSDETKHNIINENIAKQATLGTTVHSILERYWDKLEDKNILQTIFFKYAIFNEEVKSKVKQYLENFKSTNTYKKLKDGIEYNFELDLHNFVDGQQSLSIVDLVYFDKEKNGWVIVDFKSNNISKHKDLVKFAIDQGYDKQLETYQTLCESKDMNVVGKLLLFLEDGSEIEF